MKPYNDILLDLPVSGVATITLNRPQARNALRNQALAEIAECLDSFVEDNSVRCILITGGDRVFAAGADITEMAKMAKNDILNDPRPAYWARIAAFPKPIIAVVNGYALGAGCELAMHADIIVAGTNAQFGQPEINLGIIPGAGGTQRLIRAVGKALASKMILSGEFISAETALTAGLVAETTLPELSLERGMQLAESIAGKSPLALEQAKAALNQAYESPLSDGLTFERKAFVKLAHSEDRSEGIAAFLEKREPEFIGQ